MSIHAFVFFLAFAHNAFAVNVLGIVSLPIRSHYMAFQTLFQGLAERGHNVTVINNFPDKDPPINLNFIDLQQINRPSVPPLHYFEEIHHSYIHMRNMYNHINKNPKIEENQCDTLFTNKDAKSRLGVKYDVILVEQFLSDCDLVYAATMYDAPIIGITSHTMLPWAYSRLGIPFDVTTDAFYFSNAGPNPPLWGRIENELTKLVFTTVGRWYIHSNLYNVFARHLPQTNVDIERIASDRMKMAFSYQHFSLTGARLVSPQVLEMGGIHVGKPKPVTPDIEEFLSGAKHGAIYVSFGSMLKPSTMSAAKAQEFLTAFKKLPYRIIWKNENASLPQEYRDQILISDWFPQLDILCHPKVLAFVSHGGMLSISESTHCGKPILTVPFFGDQFSNSAAVNAVGMGKTLYFNQINAQNLEQTILALTSKEMQENARRVSALWHDRPMTALDSAIYWTEYVARHRSAPPSLPSKSGAWFQKSLIDVYSVIILMLVLLLFSFYVVLKLVLCILLSILKIMFFANKPKME